MDMENFDLFDFNYEITDPLWREELENCIVNYFLFYEIGAETIDLFKHNFKTQFVRMMPYYNKLYMSSLKVVDPILTQKVVEIVTDNTTNVDSVKFEGNLMVRDNGETFTDNNNTTNRTDYPQTTGSTVDIPTERLQQVGDMQSNTVNKSDNISESDTSTVGTTNKNYKREIEGFIGNQNQLLQEYRANILRVNDLIIKELKHCFILVY